MKWKIILADHEFDVSAYSIPSAQRVELVGRAVLELIEAEKYPLPDGSIEVSLLSNEEIRQINSEYRSKDYATDVLSFDYREETDQHNPEAVIGELLISPEVVKTQAPEFGNTVTLEWLRVLIHGFLHICGLDHENVPEECVMEMQKYEDILFTKLSLNFESAQ